MSARAPLYALDPCPFCGAPQKTVSGVYGGPDRVVVKRGRDGKRRKRVDRGPLIGCAVQCVNCRASLERRFAVFRTQAITKTALVAAWNLRTPGAPWACPLCGCETVALRIREASWLGRHDEEPGPATIEFAICAQCRLTLPGWKKTVAFWQPRRARNLWKIRRPPSSYRSHSDIQERALANYHEEQLEYARWLWALRHRARFHVIHRPPLE